MGVKGAAPPNVWNWIAPCSSKHIIVQGRGKKIEQKTFLGDSDYQAILKGLACIANDSA
jgi:hypothetical protein